MTEKGILLKKFQQVTKTATEANSIIEDVPQPDKYLLNLFGNRFHALRLYRKKNVRNMHAPEKDAKAARYYAYSLQQQRWQCHYNYFNYEPRPKTVVHVPRNACGSTGSLMSEKGMVLKNLNR